MLRTQADLLTLRRSKALKEGKNSEVERLFDEEIKILEGFERLLRTLYEKELVGYGEILKIQREVLALKREKAETMRTEQLKGEKLRLLQSVPREGTYAAGPEREQYLELLRLRGEVTRLHGYEREAEQARQMQMQEARAKLIEAKAALDRTTELNSQGMTTLSHVDHARLEVEALTAEAAGDTAEVVRIRLQQAEKELARASQLLSKTLISEAEFEKAKYRVEMLKAEARGDKDGMAWIRLLQAERDLSRANELRRQSIISDAEYQKALRKVELAKGQVSSLRHPD